MRNAFYKNHIVSSFHTFSLKFGLGALLLSIACNFAMPQAAISQESARAIALDFTKVAKEAIPAVVTINVKINSKQKGSFLNPWGFSEDDLRDTFGSDFFKRFFKIPKEDLEETAKASGFVVSPDGHILTNSHVVKDASSITVSLNDGREFTGTLLGQDPNTDVALIKIDAKDLPFLTLGNSDQLQVGEWAIAIGNPLGLQASLTVGVISATGRNGLDLARIEDFIQTDAAINRGNSGGPLMTIDGKVAGMNTAIVTNMGSGGYIGIGFAIPSNILKHVMDELIATGKVSRGFVGVMLQQMDQNLAKAFNLDKAEGALVTEINKGSPAEKSGLKQGDIIIKYNKHPVTQIGAFRNAIALMKPGQRINLTVLREGKTIELPIEIGNFPGDEEHEAKSTTELKETKENIYGFSVQELNAELARSLGLRSEDKGVVISNVKPGTPAAWAGMKPGIIILAANQKKVESLADFNTALEASEKGRPLLLLIKQGDATRFVSLLVK